MVNPPKDQGATQQEPGNLSQIGSYFKEHGRVLKKTRQKLLGSPLDTLMTSTVIAIALALPIGFYLLLANIEALGPRWQGHSQISLFLKQGTTDVQAKRFADKLATLPEIASVHVISQQEALAEFENIAGMDEVLRHLPANPLPIVIEVLPAASKVSRKTSAALLQKLEKASLVELAQLDLAWVERLSIMITIGQRLALGMIIFLSLGVLLVIGNTIRLEIESRRAEIEVAQLVGATRAFVRRPFLYSGAAYGLIGGLFALGIVSAALLFLSQPVAELAGLYRNRQEILTLRPQDAIYLLTMALCLGLTGSWLSVNRHLEKLKPQ